jgi:hypothetical protein
VQSASVTVDATTLVDKTTPQYRIENVVGNNNAGAGFVVRTRGDGYAAVIGETVTVGEVELTFWTSAAADTPVKHMILNKDGNLGLGSGVNMTRALFTISGAIFDPADTGGEQQDLFLASDAQTAGVGIYGGGIGFGRPDGNSDRRKAGIASKQTGSDANQTGIAFFTYSSTTTAIETVTERMVLEHNGGLILGTGALGTTATEGFLYIPSCAGIPTGTPDSHTGRVPMVYDSANDNYYIYNSGWQPIGDEVFTQEFVSAEQTITSAGLLTLAHGFGIDLKTFQLFIICTSAEMDYSIDDVIAVSLGSYGSKAQGVWSDSTNIYFRFHNGPNTFGGVNKTTGAQVQFTNTKWKLIVRAYT